MADERAAGRVIVLNGGSSSGKTTIARKLQETLDGSWVLVGIDLFIWMMPPRLMHEADGLDIVDGVLTPGEEFTRLYAAFRGAVATLAREGVDVIVDDVTLDAARDQQRWHGALAGLDVCWVGVRCAADTVAAREAARGDRPPGIAQRQATAVHEGMRYDLEVDTDAHDLAHCLGAITDAVRSRWSVPSTIASNDLPELPARSAFGADGEIALAPWER